MQADRVAITNRCPGPRLQCAVVLRTSLQLRAANQAFTLLPICQTYLGSVALTTQSPTIRALKIHGLCEAAVRALRQ